MGIAKPERMRLGVYSQAALVETNFGEYNPPQSFGEGNLDDRGLLEAIARGDQHSLEVLISKYERRLAGFLRGILSNPADVDEVFWQTVTAVWESARRFEGRSEPCFWILGIARNLAYRRIDRLRRRSSEPLEQHLPDLRAGPFEQCRRREVADAVPLLNEIHREVLILFYWFGYTSREISEVLDLPQATVRTRLHHARKNLKDLLTPDAAGIDAE